MEPRRLRAPRADAAVLAEPPLDRAGAMLAENGPRLSAWDHDFQGRRAPRLRAMARMEVLAKAREFHRAFDLDLPTSGESQGPLIVTGHQPELFHPGVWIKNFAVAGIARRQAGAALNLIVDDDIPKGSTIRVPHESAGTLRAVAIDFDNWGSEVPYEDWLISDETRFASFADRVRDVLGDGVPDPILNDFWPKVLANVGRTDRTGLRFAAGRRALEADWGVRNWEVPLSEVCRTDAFLWFASNVLAQLPRFQEIHNSALDRYRALYHIRSKNHPVPALRVEGDWREAPFWAWRSQKPRRRPLMARQRGSSMELRIAGEDAVLIEIPLAPDREACCAVEALRDLPARGVRLRTRALTTTMFARLILGDLFLHGIGGAKYDELGDEIVRRFYGFEPPSYATLSMTTWLGLGEDPATSEALVSARHRLRELTFNADRSLGETADPAIRAVIEAKQQAISGPTETRRQRVARYYEIRRLNEALQLAVAERRRQLDGEIDQLFQGLKRNALVRSREYAFVLHSRSRLRATLERAVPDAFGP